MNTLSFTRIYAVVLRHMYNLKNNFDRMVDTFYWPVVDLVLFGLTVGAFSGKESGYFAAVIVGVALWFVVWRSQGDITVNLLEELWSENMANLFSTPLSIAEWIIGLLAVSIIKLCLTLILLAVGSYVLYAVHITSIGWTGIFFIASLLVTGWAFGLFMGGLFLRFGTSIQTLAWSGVIMLMPISGTYFPVSSLPVWVQYVSKAVPSSYVFEGMRKVIIQGTFDWQGVAISFGLNAVYLSIAIWFFLRSYAVARRHGIAHLQ